MTTPRKYQHATEQPELAEEVSRNRGRSSVPDRPGATRIRSLAGVDIVNMRLTVKVRAKEDGHWLCAAGAVNSAHRPISDSQE